MVSKKKGKRAKWQNDNDILVATLLSLYDTLRDILRTLRASLRYLASPKIFISQFRRFRARLSIFLPLFFPSLCVYFIRDVSHYHRARMYARVRVGWKHSDKVRGRNEQPKRTKWTHLASPRINKQQQMTAHIRPFFSDESISMCAGSRVRNNFLITPFLGE